MTKLKLSSVSWCSHTGFEFSASHPAVIFGSLDNAFPKTAQALHAEELFSLTIVVRCNVTVCYKATLYFLMTQKEFFRPKLFRSSD